MADRHRPVRPTYEALVEQSLLGVYGVQDERVVYANPRMGEHQRHVRAFQGDRALYERKRRNRA